MFYNKGIAEGVLARDPKQVANGVVLLTLRIRDDRVNPKTGKRENHFPKFVIFGKESDKALANLVKGQEVGIEYKLETGMKEKNGEVRYYEDKVVTRIKYGRKPQPKEDMKENSD